MPVFARSEEKPNYFCKRRTTFYSITVAYCDPPVLRIDGGKSPILGSLHITAFPLEMTIEESDLPFISTFEVHEAYRNQGLGSEILKVALELLAKAGYPAVDLCVAADNTDAIRLYERFGFVHLDDYGVKRMRKFLR